MAAKGGFKKIRVAHLIGSLNIGGAENQVTMLLNALDPEQFERHVITMSESAQGFRAMLAGDVKYFCMHYRRRSALISLYHLYRYIKDHRIDVLHCHMYHAAVKGALVGRLATVPLILVSEHGKNTWKRWWHRVIERQLVSRWASVRVAVSEDIRQLRIEKDGIRADSVILMPNAVDTSVMLSNNTAAPKKLGSLGRLVDAKDFTILFQAVKILNGQGYDVSLEIAGDGIERESLEKAVSELGLQAVVSLPGIQNGREFLSSIDMFVMSSKREGAPVALLEAMAHGLPIVATAVGGIPETIKDGKEGLLSPPGQPEALAVNIARMIDDQALRVRLGKSAREKVESCYGIENIVSEWETLYEKKLAMR